MEVKFQMRNRPALVQAMGGVLGNMGWLLLDKLLRMGIAFAVGIWLARHLGTAQFGQLNYATAFVGLFLAIAEIGLTGIVVRELVKRPADAPILLGSAFVMQLVGGLLAITAIFSAINWLQPEDPIARALVGVYSFTLVFRATDVVRNWFESQVLSKYVVWVENSILTVGAGVRVVLILKDASLLSFVWLSVLESLLIASGLLSLYQIKTKGLRRWRANYPTMQRLWRESWPLMLAGLAVMLYMRVDVVMLQSMSGDHEVGLYSAASKISEIMYFIPGVIVSSLSPTLVGLHATDHLQFERRLRQLYFVLAWLAIAFSVLLSLGATPLVELLFGHQFAAAAPVLAIHAWANVAVFLGVASSQYLVISGLQRFAFIRTLIGLVCNVLLNLILIPQHGAAGAAMATVVSYFIATFSILLFPVSRDQAYLMLLSPFQAPHK